MGGEISASRFATCCAFENAPTRLCAMRNRLGPDALSGGAERPVCLLYVAPHAQPLAGLRRHCPSGTGLGVRAQSAAPLLRRHFTAVRVLWSCGLGWTPPWGPGGPRFTWRTGRCPPTPNAALGRLPTCVGSPRLQARPAGAGRHEGAAAKRLAPSCPRWDRMAPIRRYAGICAQISENTNAACDNIYKKEVDYEIPLGAIVST
jgi:hypothetical protein